MNSIDILKIMYWIILLNHDFYYYNNLEFSFIDNELNWNCMYASISILAIETFYAAVTFALKNVSTMLVK